MIDAAIQIASGIVPDSGARHRARPEHDASPRHAALRIIDVLAVHHSHRRFWVEGDSRETKQDAPGNPRNRF